MVPQSLSLFYWFSSDLFFATKTTAHPLYTHLNQSMPFNKSFSRVFHSVCLSPLLIRCFSPLFVVRHAKLLYTCKVWAAELSLKTNAILRGFLWQIKFGFKLSRCFSFHLVFVLFLAEFISLQLTHAQFIVLGSRRRRLLFFAPPLIFPRFSAIDCVHFCSLFST